MRITGGQATGRRLVTPRGLNIRPTSDRVREAVFDIVGHELAGFRVLDLFAGTGSLGLEALSRGAARALFVDNFKQAIQIIKKNLALCGYEDSAGILKWNLRRGFPANHALIMEGFDLVFMDPPYGEGFIPLLLGELSTGNVLSAGSRVVAESRKTESPPDYFSSLELTNTRLYGDTRISLYAYGDTQ
jgi:16S rRNA (guanine966-N2)-methyltransferase